MLQTGQDNASLDEVNKKTGSIYSIPKPKQTEYGTRISSNIIVAVAVAVTVVAFVEKCSLNVRFFCLCLVIVP